MKMYLKLAAMVEFAWAVGPPATSFAASMTHAGIKAYVQVNLANPGGAAPVTAPPTAPPTAGPTAAPLAGCTTDAQCMNGGKCNTAAMACQCSGPGFLGPTCAIKSANLVSADLHNAPHCPCSYPGCRSLYSLQKL